MVMYEAIIFSGPSCRRYSMWTIIWLIDTSLHHVLTWNFAQWLEEIGNKPSSSKQSQ